LRWGKSSIKRQIRRSATAGRGNAFDAQNAGALSTALERALRAPFRVFDDDGREVGSGTVGGEALTLAPGTYRVEVLTNPRQVFAQVVIEDGKQVTLTLEAHPSAPG
jgi:hypothetical protein